MSVLVVYYSKTFKYPKKLAKKDKMLVTLFLKDLKTIINP